MNIEKERALSKRQAWACERALEKRCRCRCGGAMHGAKRIKNENDLAELPADDPHHFTPEKESPFGPMRCVVKVEELYSWSHQVRLYLECGHSLWKKRSRAHFKKMHCTECRLARKPEKNISELKIGPFPLVRQSARPPRPRDLAGKPKKYARRARRRSAGAR